MMQIFKRKFSQIYKLKNSAELKICVNLRLKICVIRVPSSAKQIKPCSENLFV